MNKIEMKAGWSAKVSWLDITKWIVSNEIKYGDWIYEWATDETLSSGNVASISFKSEEDAIAFRLRFGI
jgi:hypothetical protein